MSEAGRERVWLLLIVMVGVAFRSGIITVMDHTPGSDAAAYYYMATSLVSGEGIIDGNGNLALYNVGYPLFILAPVIAIFGDQLIVVRLVNTLLVAVAMVLCYATAKEAGAGRVGRLVAAAMWALYLPAAINVLYLLKENLLVPLMLGVIWCSLRLMRNPSWGWAAACGVLLGLIALTGNAGLCLVACVFFALMLASCSPRRKLSLFAVSVFLSCAVAAPWAARNMMVLGAPVLNTNGGFNFYLGNNPAATGFFVSIADTPRGATWHALRDEGELHASNTLRREAVMWIQENPIDFLMLAGKKLIIFWTPPFHAGEGEPSRVERLARIVWAAQFLLLVLPALGSLFLPSLRNRQVLIIWIAIAGYSAVHMLFYVNYRYRLSIMPMVCVLAALWVEAFLAKLVGSAKFSESDRAPVTDAEPA